MPIFNFSFTVGAPRSAVSQFHADTNALRRLSPPPIFAQLHHVEPLAEGSVAEFTLWFGPVPARWRAVHTQVSPAGFTDTQEQGPLQFWQHRHEFVALDEDHTKVRDTVQYRHPAGWRGLLTRLIFNKPGLWALFSYRKLATRRAVARVETQKSTRPGWAIPAFLAAILALGALLVGYWRNRS